MPQSPVPAGIYIHVPFCERKCVYCDFYSVEGVAQMERYLDALDAEFRLYASQAAGTPIGTVYLGGGTPSLMTPRQLEGVLGPVRELYALEPDAEITVEANPGTVSPESLHAFRSLGVNRLSFGVQSFHDDELRFLGRIHTVEDVRRSLAVARAAGFDNISIDLIYSLPGQTVAGWRATLDEALRHKPEHISAYSLIVEEHTPLFSMVREGCVIPNNDAVEAALYEETMKTLADAGYEQYEVSNYAVPGRRSRHNASYWSHANYLGFGPSAHAFWWDRSTGSARRWSNVRNIAAYADALLDGRRPLDKEEVLSSRELLDEQLFLGLRSDGMDLARIRDELGAVLTDRQLRTLADASAAGLLIRNGERYRLTPRGYLVCDELCARLLVP